MEGLTLDDEPEHDVSTKINIADNTVITLFQMLIKTYMKLI